MDTTADTLAELEQQITQLATELYDTLSAMQNQQPVQEDLINRYAERVSAIGSAACSMELQGLNQCCVYFENALQSLGKSAASMNDEIRVALDQWPMLVMAYLHAPQDTNSRDALVNALLQPAWETDFTAQCAEELRNVFAHDGNTHIFSNANSDNEAEDQRENNISNEFNTLQETASDNYLYTSAAHREDESLQSPSFISDHNVSLDKHNADIGFDLHLMHALQQEVLDTMGILLNELDAQGSNNNAQNITDALNLAADRIEILGMSAANAGFSGLMDVSMLFHHALQELARAQRAISREEYAQLETWRSHVVAYLDNPLNVVNNNELVDMLMNISWMQLISREEADILKDMLLPVEIEMQAPAAFDEHSDTREEVDPVSPIEETITLSSDVAETQAADAALTSQAQAELPSHSGASRSMSKNQVELLSLVSNEIQSAANTLASTLNSSFNDKLEEIARIGALTEYAASIEPFILAAESVGLTGLQRTLQFIQANASAMAHEIDNTDKSLRRLLQCWPALAVAYLNNIFDTQAAQNLLEHIFDDRWLIALREQDSEDIRQLVLHPDLAYDEDEQPQRQNTATLDDISLQLPEDVNQQLLDSLLQELPGHTGEFTAAITRIVQGEASDADLNKAQRIAHTLKGSANTVGIAGIANLTHHIEDILDAFCKLGQMPGTRLGEVLMNAADVLEMMCESLLDSTDAPQQQALEVLQAVLDWANMIDREGITQDEQVLPTNHNQLHLNNAPQEDTQQQNKATPETLLRVPAKLIDELLRIVGESIIVTTQLQDRLSLAKQQTAAVREQNELFQNLTYELEQIVDIQGLSTQQSREGIHEQFDSLELDQYNELHTVTRRLVEAATDARELTRGIEDHLASIDNFLVDQSRLHKQNQEAVMQTRMVPVQNIVPRLQRAVRQTCRLTGKQAQLHISGADTLIDSDVLDDLTDPLMHLIRNAVDHGIESVEDRQSSGKEDAGNIHLEFHREGDHIVVRCADDGRGLDFQAIETKALEKNIIHDSDRLSQDELARLILMPGFTTRAGTTQVSGRGIGMDVVYSSVLDMKGSLRIDSKPRSGSVFEMYLPITLISVHALLVKANQQTIALSTRGIEQMLHSDAGEISREDDKFIFAYNDDLIELSYLSTMLKLPFLEPLGEEQNYPVLLVKEETGRLRAVLVEKVLGSQDLVIKQLNQYVPRIPGMEGAAILGNGSVTPVLDLPVLLQHQAGINAAYLMDAADMLMGQPGVARALVVDDSLSARRSLAQFVRDLGYEVTTARDGLEAIDAIKLRKPDILLVDLEMPRMNGLELVGHLRMSEETQHLPVIMITSRSTEKHRQQADKQGVDVYLTKPFSEEQLLAHIEQLLSRSDTVQHQAAG